MLQIHENQSSGQHWAKTWTYIIMPLVAYWNLHLEGPSISIWNRSWLYQGNGGQTCQRLKLSAVAHFTRALCRQLLNSSAAIWKNLSIITYLIRFKIFHVVFFPYMCLFNKFLYFYIFWQFCFPTLYGLDLLSE